MATFGLNEEQIQEIKGILSKFSEISEVILFGSRAMGNYKPGSDVDLAIKGNVNAYIAANIKFELEEETYLPYFFDILSYPSITDDALREQIDAYGKVFYRAGE